MRRSRTHESGTKTFGLDDDASVEDFMARFSNPDIYVAPDEADTQFDRFARSGNPDFQQAASSALSQMDPSQFASAAQSLDPGQRAGLAGGLLGALGNAGIDLGSIGRMLGLSSTDPQQMQPNDIAQLMGQGALAIMAARFLTKRNR